MGYGPDAGAHIELGPYPNRVPDEYVAEVTRQVEDERRKGWLRQVAPPPHATNAPIQVAVQPHKVRRITDYSNRGPTGAMRGVNRWVQHGLLPHPEMHSVRDLSRAVHACTRRSDEPPLLLVRDLSKAYRRIAVRPEDWSSLAFKWAGRWYVDTRLPFGHAASAAYCCALSQAICDVLTQRWAGQAYALAYVDDFVLISTPSFAGVAAADLHQCLHDLGLPVSQPKVQHDGEWSTKAEWIGFVHDTVAKTHSLARAKRDAYISGLETVATGWPQVPLHEWDQVIGRLSHVASAFTPARAIIAEMLRMVTKRGRMVRISVGALPLLRWWKNFLTNMPRAAPMVRAPSPNDPAVTSDASLWGLGWAKFRNLFDATYGGQEDVEWAGWAHVCGRRQPGDMTLLEAWAALRAVQSAADLGVTGPLWCGVDNVALEWALRKGRSKSLRVNRVVMRALFAAAEAGLHIFPFRVSTSQNWVADRLSRIPQRDESDRRVRNLRARQGRHIPRETSS